MILLCGIPSETPLAMVAQQLTGLGAPFVMFNQRRFADYREWSQSAGGPLWWPRDRSFSSRCHPGVSHWRTPG
jgi:hypothetical protein